MLVVFIIDSGNNLSLSASNEMPDSGGLMFFTWVFLSQCTKSPYLSCCFAQHWYLIVPECSAAPALHWAATSLQEAEAPQTNMNFLSHLRDTTLHYFWWLCSWNCHWNLFDSTEKKIHEGSCTALKNKKQRAVIQSCSPWRGGEIENRCSIKGM